MTFPYFLIVDEVGVTSLSCPGFAQVMRPKKTLLMVKVTPTAEKTVRMCACYFSLFVYIN